MKGGKLFVFEVLVRMLWEVGTERWWEGKNEGKEAYRATEGSFS